MAYNGYRLKINNTVFPNIYMQRGSYDIGNNPRVVETYIDSLGISHDVLYPSTKAVINFSVKEHSTQEHSVLSAFFVSRSVVSVQYFDDNSSSYKQGTFRVKDFKWSHNNATNGSIDYGATAITLEEY